jgi:hypothetical protein
MPAPSEAPRDLPSPTRHPLVVYLLLCLMAASLTGIIAAHQPAFDPNATLGDHLFYRSMAYNLFVVSRPDLNTPPAALRAGHERPETRRWLRPGNHLNRQPPYVYRVVAPLTARAIGYVAANDDAAAGFRVLALASVCAAAFFTSATVYALTRDPLAAAVASIALFANPWFANFNLYDYMLSDPLAMALIACSIWALARGMRTVFWISAFVAIFTKEIAIVLIPIGLWREYAQSGRVRPASIAIAASAAIAYGVFRVAMPIPGDSYSLSAVVQSPYGFPVWAWRTFGILGISALARLRYVRLAIELLPLSLAAVAGSLLVTDHERALIYAFPMVVVAILGVRTRSARDRLLAYLPVVYVVAVRLAQIRVAWAGWWVVAVAAAALIEPLFTLSRRKPMPALATT